MRDHYIELQRERNTFILRCKLENNMSKYDLTRAFTYEYCPYCGERLDFSEAMEKSNIVIKGP